MKNEKNDGRIKVYFVDDHPIFREGLRHVLQSDARIRIVGEAGDGETALAEIRSLKPQVAILDIDLAGKGGLEIARALQNFQPPVPAVMLTMCKEESMVNAALDCGAKGYILKDNASTDLLNGIKAVAAGGVFLSPSISGYLLRRAERAAALRQEKPALARITPMERRVLKYLAENKTSKEIAEHLFISPRTVETHRANLAAKLDLRGYHSLLQFAIEHRAEL